MNFTPAQLKKLKAISDLSLQIERQSQDSNFDPGALKILAELLLEQKNENIFELQKLADVPRHFSSAMTLRHFTNLMIPLERLLDRSLRDDDFLNPAKISTEDQPQKEKIQRPIYFVLDNVRSGFNVGSVFRLADCVGASKLLLCGYTPGPSNESVLKTSLSATQHIEAQNFENVEEALKLLKTLGIRIVALETAKPSVPLFATPLKGPIAFVVGNERFGLNYSVLKSVDEVRHIPMFGVKNSLNVAQALAVAAFEWSRQNP